MLKGIDENLKNHGCPGNANLANTFACDIGWFVPYYIPKTPQETLLREHFFWSSKTNIIHRRICFHKRCRCRKQLAVQQRTKRMLCRFNLWQNSKITYCIT